MQGQGQGQGQGLTSLLIGLSPFICERNRRHKSPRGTHLAGRLRFLTEIAVNL